MAEPPRRFRSAGSGGQRGAPARGTEFQFAGSRSQLSGPAKALIAARRYQQATASQRQDSGPAPAPRSFLSGAELSALRGGYRSERRFDGEDRTISTSAFDAGP